MSFLGIRGIAKDERQRCLAYYEAEVGVTAFQTKEADLFNEVLSLDATDVAAGVMHERSWDYNKNPPPEDWDGGAEMKSK